MHELLILLLVVIAVAAVTTMVFRFVGPCLRILEYILVSGSVLSILFVAFYVGAEVVMRYLFNSPLPGHLELAELMMPVIVFLALSYTQATHGHVGMDLLTDLLPEQTRRVLSVVTLVLSLCICAVIGYFSLKNTMLMIEYDDVTMSPPYFKTWPAGAAIPLGYILISLRIYIQLLHMLMPQRFEAHEPHDAELYSNN